MPTADELVKLLWEIANGKYGASTKERVEAIKLLLDFGYLRKD
jgi:hypothetical protein